jgi:menaquinone-dependent protoporphyrinogen oxidase
MSTILIGFATRYGSTHEAAEAVAAALAERGLATRTELLRDVTDLAGCAGVVVGAPLFMGAWHKDAHAFLRKHKAALSRLPVAVFALGPTHEPYDPAEWASSQAQLDKGLGRHGWLEPVAVGLFGGRYDPAYLRFPMTKMAGNAPASDIRDGAKVSAWAGELADVFGAAAP